MTFSDFRKQGHFPTLIASFLYFDISFMVWVILGPLGPYLGESLHLTASQKGFLVAVPLLAGSFFRPILGAMADRFGGRLTGMIGLGLTLLPLFLGWRFASALPHFFLIGCLLGVAGASFAVALPLASRWYPPELQGLAMGIAGAGNSGTVLATLFMPRLAKFVGWQNAFGIAMLPVLTVLLIFALTARDAPGERRRIGWSDYKTLFSQSDTAWFCLFYSFTFGGFAGLASFLTLFYADQYQLAKVSAGDLATLSVIAGSALRPVGGWLSDRFGGYRLLLFVLLGASMLLGSLMALPAVEVAALQLTLTMALLGMGNGAVFQLVPQRFAGSVGIITGMVGAAGGIGGFFLPSLLGVCKDRTGTYASGFLVLAGGFALAFAALLLLGPAWLARWDRAVAERSGVFSYAKWLNQQESA
jgi:MFS transporter, NNP family, nitrate/nitrite transporter